MINVGVIGCGYWGPNLVRNFMACPQTYLLQVCDKSINKAQEAAVSYPHLKVTSDPGDLFFDPDIDAIAIATPVFSHYELAKQALENGKHVLVEKPLACSVNEALKLIEIAAQNNLILMCDHTFCYTGAVRKIKEIIHSGEIGDILYYDSTRINLGLFQHDINVIWDLAVHDLAIIDFLLERQPLQVSAHGMAHAGKMENIAYVTLRYPENLIAHFHVNWMSPVKIRKTLIGGTKKMIEWNDLVPSERVKIYDKGVSLDDHDERKKDQILISYRIGDIVSPNIDSSEALAGVVNEFADSILEGRTPLTDGRAGLRIVKILEATDRSIKENGANINIE